MKRFVSLLLCLIILTGCMVSYADTQKTYSEEFSTVEPLIVSKGETVAIQMNIRVPANGMYFLISPSYEMTGDIISIYRWNKNILDTYGSEPVYSETIGSRGGSERVGIDFLNKTGKPLEPGEYVFSLSHNAGLNLLFDNYIPSRNFIKTYIDGYTVKGTVKSEIDFAEEAKKYFTETSLNEDYPFQTAPPESEIQADSAITQMNIDPTLWSAVDGLGRTLPGYSEVGAKNDKVVGIFYWTWHSPSSAPAVSNTKLSLEHPEMMDDYYHPLWNTVGWGVNFWDEPLFGYYNEQDEYVLRKHAEMLADAGVDFVAFDCTNGDNIFWPQLQVLLKVWSEAREQGVRTPQVCCMLNFSYSEYTLSSVRQLYNVMYRDGLYQDLWFYWDGKPLIIGYGTDMDPTDTEQAQYMKFFTFKKNVASYFESNKSCDYWGWLHVYPQALYKKDDGTVEMTTVGISQNANYDGMFLSAMNGKYNMSRSFTMQKNYSYSYMCRGKTVKVTKDIDNALLYGLNFQEQWDYAISKDPDMIFVTSWNEWTAGRYEEWNGVENAFPDEYDALNSRDAEPSRGILKDHYYYQLVANIRRYKGVSKPQGQTEDVTIDINGDVSQWDNSDIITYNHYTKNTYDRDVTNSYGNSYQNFTMRNDIVTAKVAYDSKNVYFYVKTVDELTPETDEKWMRLLIDSASDKSKPADWEGFEFIVNRVNPGSDGAVLEKSKGGWNWETVGKVKYSVTGNVLQLEIPRSYLGLGSGNFSFGYKWCDNNLDEDGDIMTLYTDGDAAPGGRFTFAFSSSAYKEKKWSSALTVIAIIAAAVAVSAAAATVLILKKKGSQKA